MAQRSPARRRRVLRQPVRQSGEPGRARGDDRARRSGSRSGRDSMRSWSASAPAARLPASALFAAFAEDRDGARRSGRLGAGAARRDRHLGEAGSWLVEGIGEDFVPPICDLSRVEPTRSTTRRASRRPRASAQGRHPRRHVVRHAACSGPALLPEQKPEARREFVCDSGAKYLSKVFNDALHGRSGLVRARAHHGDLRDVVINRYDEGSEIFVSPNETVASAFARMRAADVCSCR